MEAELVARAARGRLAVRAEVGRLPRRARERRRRARASGAATSGRCSATSPSSRPLGDLLPPHSALDGEIVIERDGRARLRRHADAAPSGREPRPQALRRDPGAVRRLRRPALEGRSRVHELPLEKRRARAREARGVPRSRRRRATATRRASWLDALEAAGLDGVIAKRLGLPYLPGSREGVVKVKAHKTADCVVVGVRWKEKPTALATLLLGLYGDDGELDYVGSAAVAASAPRRDPRARPAAARRTRPSAASPSRTAGAAASSRSRRSGPSSSSRCATTRCRATASATGRS